jgi:hypothetical protein
MVLTLLKGCSSSSATLFKLKLFLLGLFNSLTCQLALLTCQMSYVQCQNKKHKEGSFLLQLNLNQAFIWTNYQVPEAIS